MSLGIHPALGERLVAGRIHELSKLGIGHFMPVDPEPIDAHGMAEALFRAIPIGPHGEATAGNEHHPGFVPLLRRHSGIGLAVLDCGAGLGRSCTQDEGRELGQSPARAPDFENRNGQVTPNAAAGRIHVFVAMP